MAAKDDFDLFSSVAEMLGLEADETENFITSAMRRRGHKPRIDWDDNEESGDSGSGGDFFSQRRRTREVRRPNRQGHDRRQASGGGWQYDS